MFVYIQFNTKQPNTSTYRWLGMQRLAKLCNIEHQIKYRHIECVMNIWNISYWDTIIHSFYIQNAVTIVVLSIFRSNVDYILKTFIAILANNVKLSKFIVINKQFGFCLHQSVKTSRFRSSSEFKMLIFNQHLLMRLKLNKYYFKDSNTRLLN